MRSPLLGIVGGFIFEQKKGHLFRNVLFFALLLCVAPEGIEPSS